MDGGLDKRPSIATKPSAIITIPASALAVTLSFRNPEHNISAMMDMRNVTSEM